MLSRMTGIGFILFAATTAFAEKQIIEDTPFWQEIAVRYVPEVDIAKYQLRAVRADRDGRIIIETDNGLLKAEDGRIVPYEEMQGVSQRKIIDLETLRGKFVFLTDEFLLPLHGAGGDYLKNGDAGYSRVGVFSPGRYVLLTPTKIVEVNAGKLESIDNDGYTEIAYAGEGGPIFLWSPTKLARYDGHGKLVSFPTPQPEIRDVLPLDDGAAQVATASGQFLIDKDKVTPLTQPLPVEELTVIARDKEGRLWLGSENGAFSIGENGKLSYYAGQRWLPDNYVVDITFDRNGDPLILTKTGLAQLDFERMTLADKADVYLENLRKHHIRFGLVSDVSTPGGDYAKLRMHDSDNDGLWSSMYLASEAFRLAVTGSDDARDNLLDGLDALERLTTISGIPGFQARTFELDGFRVSDPHAWRKRPEGDFEWKGTTSSDEICGTMFFYSVLYDTLAKDEPVLRERIARIVGATIGHIVDNDLYIIDADGEPTRWGFWNPANINTPAALHDRRLNSIEILGFLQLAYALTKEQKFLNTYNELVDKYGYAENTVRYLPDPLGPWNHSDDELYWLSYYVLLDNPIRESLMPTFKKSATEQFEANKRKRNPLWNIIYGSRTGEPIDITGVAFWLREFPIDMRRWHAQNSHRKDVTIVRRPFVAPETSELLPQDERFTHKWNGNEMTPDGGSGPGSAESGAEFLLPYWMGRYYDYISKPYTDSQ